MPKSFPRLQGIVTEVSDGFTVTVWLASGDPLEALTLITDEPSASAQAAIDLVRELAKARGIPVEQIDLRLRLAHDAAPKNKPTN